ncbi:MAG: M55 family metallopeptidase [Anaerolineae bacterium]|nr:M55 family metallopeptidase [Anaerolineae bacterium]
MDPVQTAYVVTDMEGVAGVDDWDPRHAPHAAEALGVYQRAEVQRLLTGEVNAVAEGLFAAGVTEVIVNDGHGAGRTILPEELISGIKIVRGTQRPQVLPGISRRVDILVQVGMHAMSDTPEANLAHTQSKGVKAYRVNGRPVGEMEQGAYLAGELGIPWVFTAGDEHACREAEEWVPQMVTAAVKRGLSTLSAIHLAPVDARALIRERVQLAVQRASLIAPIRPEPPVVMEIELREPGPVNLHPGGERVDAFTTRWVGDSFWDVFHRSLYGRAMPTPSD